MYKMKSFNDSHLHFLGIGLNLLEYVDLSNAKSHREIKDILSKETHRKMIIARGWHENNFSDATPFTKEVLDTVSYRIPIIAIRTCGHVLISNSRMIDLAKENLDHQVDGGTFDLNTGVFTENALELIYRHMELPSKERIKEYLIAANTYFLSHGVTSCGSDDFSTLPVPYERIIEAYKECYEEGLIQVKIHQQVNLPKKELLMDFIQKGYVGKKIGQMTFGPLKLLADGSLGGRTAYMREPYSDELSNKGIQVFSDSELFDLIYLSDSHQMDVAIHGIGDACIDQILDAIEKSISITKRNHKHSIIHAQLANKHQIKRMKELGVSAQVQPIFLNSDIPIIKQRLGQRYLETYLFKTMMKEGILVTLSTDSPVEPLNPFLNLYCAITRKSIKHDTEIFLENEKFTIEEALQLYTETPYILTNQPQPNDYIITNKDIFDVEDHELLDMIVLETYIDNKLVYKK